MQTKATYVKGYGASDYSAPISTRIPTAGEDAPPIPEALIDRLRVLEAENKRLREAMVTAVIPLEALRISGANKLHCQEVQDGIEAGVMAVREALDHIDLPRMTLG